MSSSLKTLYSNQNEMRQNLFVLPQSPVKVLHFYMAVFVAVSGQILPSCFSRACPRRNMSHLCTGSTVVISEAVPVSGLVSSSVLAAEPRGAEREQCVGWLGTNKAGTEK